jgi:hypothetical protein
VALTVAFGVLSGIVLLVADAVQSFEREDVRMFQASALHATVRRWAPVRDCVCVGAPTDPTRGSSRC